MRRATYLPALAVVALLAAAALADVPQLLNYQGRLTDPSGNPKNGTFTMQFAVYDAATCGSGNQLPTGSAWSETQSVTVTSGIFNVLLGSVTPLPTNLFEGGPSDASGPLRFLQVTANGEALCPRRRIVSAAYAIQANRDISVRVFSSSNVPVLDFGDVPVPFDSERWDADNMHSIAGNTSRLTARVGGKYFISGNLSFAPNSAGTRDLYVRLNGTTLIAVLRHTPFPAAMPPTEAGETIMSISTCYELQAGDYVELIASQISGTTLDVVAHPNYSPEFGMVKLP